MSDHGHRLFLGIVSLIPGQVRGDNPSIDKAQSATEELLGSVFFENAPFDDIGMIFRYGERTCLRPQSFRIVKVKGRRELQIAVELEMRMLQNATPEEMDSIFQQALLDPLIAVAEKYSLPVEGLREARSKLPTLINDSPTTMNESDPSSTSDAAVDGGSTGTEIKLYRHLAEKSEYWETWEEDDHIIVHHGPLGETGETVRLPKNPASGSEVAAEAEQRRSEGYREVPEEELTTVIVQYQIDDFGTEADLERRHEVEGLLEDRLGWTGLGHCDGGDIGSGTMNVFCLVVDPNVAVPLIVRELERGGYLEEALIAVEREKDDSIEVRWPPDYQGEFSY